MDNKNKQSNLNNSIKRKQSNNSSFRSVKSESVPINGNNNNNRPSSRFLSISIINNREETSSNDSSGLNSPLKSLNLKNNRNYTMKLEKMPS